MSRARPGEICVAHGPRDVEEQLLAALLGLLEQGDLGERLRAPVRVAVHSGSLRHHLATRLVRHAGRALLGVRIQTLRSLAHDVLAAAGQPLRDGDLVFSAAVRSVSQHEPALRALEGLEDGHALVAASAADLLDAGLGPEHAEALAEALDASSIGAAERSRAKACLHIALEAVSRLGAAGVVRASEQLAQATRLLEERGSELLPARALFVHGVADATGRLADFIEVLLRRCAAQVYIDQPAHALGGERPPESAFTQRLLLRLAGSAPVRSRPVASVRPRPELLRAPGSDAEVRAVACRVRALLDAGCAPESIGVVARVLEPYALPLRLHFLRLGIPFSGHDGRGPLRPEGRRLLALGELVRLGERVPVDRWLDALGFLPELGSRGPGEPRRSAERADLALALHALGAARLADVAALDVPARLGARTQLALPVRSGFAGVDPEEGDTEPGARARPRMLRRAVLEASVARARAAVARCAAWRGERRAADHLSELGALLDADLGWTPAVAARALLDELRAELEAALPADFPLDLVDFVRILQGALASRACVPIGGEGGGVQLLDVTEARSLTFEHLFVLGLNRDLFPRQGREDPLLPDAVRLPLRALLPDLPLKRLASEEERHLFAQLLGASEHVALSWQSCDDDGRRRAASSFVERHRLEYPADPLVEAPSLWSAADAGPRTAHERAVLAGLHGGMRALERALPGALAEVGARQPAAAARGRMAVLREQDGRPRRGRELGPYHGFVGALAVGRPDPRRNPLYVTTLEGMVRCPWQTLLVRLLRLEAPPDAQDALPRLDARLVGNAVHRALERIVAAATGEPRPLAALDASAAQAVPWPDEASFETLVRQAATDVLLDDGIALPGFARALAGLVRPLLASARRVLWPGGVPLVALGVEASGETRLGSRVLRMTVDLVELRGDRLRLIDYKTGRPASESARADTRRRAFAQAIARGRALQAPAYQSALGARGEGAYLYLRPDLDPEQALYRVAPEPHDDDLRGAFVRSSAAALQAFEAGAFFPRLVDASLAREPRACAHCEVAEACVRRDSGARRRLVRWLEQAQPVTALEQSLRVLWDLETAEAQA